MKRIDLLNGGAAIGVLLLASVLGQVLGRPAEPTRSASATTRTAPPRLVEDAGGHPVPAGDYRRIVSTSFVADGILCDLIASERIAAITEAHRNSHPEAFRTAHAVALPFGVELEVLIAQRPDLILISNAKGSPEQVARARELGYTIFDLGPMQGRESLLANIRQLGALLQVDERGAEVADRLAERLDRLRQAIPPSERQRAIYASAFGAKIYGGTVGSSYHDVLTAAGLVDIAAAAFPGQAWPQLRMEDLIRLEPAVIVTPTGGRERLRIIPGFEDLDVRIVEVDGALLGDPSLLLPAAEAVQRAVYGSAASRSSASRPAEAQ